MGLEVKTLGVTYSSAAAGICFSSSTLPAFHCPPGPGGGQESSSRDLPSLLLKVAQLCVLKTAKLWAAAAAGGGPLLCRKRCVFVLRFCCLDAVASSALIVTTLWTKVVLFLQLFLFFFLFSSVGIGRPSKRSRRTLCNEELA